MNRSGRTGRTRRRQVRFALPSGAAAPGAVIADGTEPGHGRSRRPQVGRAPHTNTYAGAAASGSVTADEAEPGPRRSSRLARRDVNDDMEDEQNRAAGAGAAAAAGPAATANAPDKMEPGPRRSSRIAKRDVHDDTEAEQEDEEESKGGGSENDNDETNEEEEGEEEDGGGGSEEDEEGDNSSEEDGDTQKNEVDDTNGHVNAQDERSDDDDGAETKTEEDDSHDDVTGNEQNDNDSRTRQLEKFVDQIDLFFKKVVDFPLLRKKGTYWKHMMHVFVVRHCHLLVYYQPEISTLDNKRKELILDFFESDDLQEYISQCRKDGQNWFDDQEHCFNSLSVKNWFDKPKFDDDDEEDKKTIDRVALYLMVLHRDKTYLTAKYMKNRYRKSRFLTVDKPLLSQFYKTMPDDSQYKLKRDREMIMNLWAQFHDDDVYVENDDIPLPALSLDGVIDENKDEENYQHEDEEDKNDKVESKVEVEHPQVEHPHEDDYQNQQEYDANNNDEVEEVDHQHEGEEEDYDNDSICEQKSNDEHSHHDDGQDGDGELSRDTAIAKQRQFNIFWADFKTFDTELHLKVATLTSATSEKVFRVCWLKPCYHVYLIRLSHLLMFYHSEFCRSKDVLDFLTECKWGDDECRVYFDNIAEESDKTFQHFGHSGSSYILGPVPKFFDDLKWYHDKDVGVIREGVEYILVSHNDKSYFTDEYMKHHHHSLFSNDDIVRIRTRIESIKNFFMTKPYYERDKKKMTDLWSSFGNTAAEHFSEDEVPWPRLEIFNLVLKSNPESMTSLNGEYENNSQQNQTERNRTESSNAPAKEINLPFYNGPVYFAGVVHSHQTTNNDSDSERENLRSLQTNNDNDQDVELAEGVNKHSTRIGGDADGVHDGDERKMIKQLRLELLEAHNHIKEQEREIAVLKARLMSSVDDNNSRVQGSRTEPVINAGREDNESRSRADDKDDISSDENEEGHKSLSISGKRVNESSEATTDPEQNDLESDANRTFTSRTGNRRSLTLLDTDESSASSVVGNSDDSHNSTSTEDDFVADANRPLTSRTGNRRPLTLLDTDESSSHGSASTEDDFVSASGCINNENVSTRKLPSDEDEEDQKSLSISVNESSGATTESEEKVECESRIDDYVDRINDDDDDDDDDFKDWQPESSSTSISSGRNDNRGPVSAGDSLGFDEGLGFRPGDGSDHDILAEDHDDGALGLVSDHVEVVGGDTCSNGSISMQPGETNDTYIRRVFQELYSQFGGNYHAIPLDEIKKAFNIRTYDEVLEKSYKDGRFMKDLLLVIHDIGFLVKNEQLNENCMPFLYRLAACQMFYTIKSPNLVSAKPDDRMKPCVDAMMVAIYFQCEGLAIHTIDINTGEDSGKRFAKERYIDNPWKQADRSLRPRPELITDQMGQVMYGAYYEKVKQSKRWDWTEEDLTESNMIISSMKASLKKYLKTKQKTNNTKGSPKKKKKKTKRRSSQGNYRKKR